MRTLTLLTVVVFAQGGKVHAADTHESLATEMIEAMSEYTKVLMTVTDKTTAMEAKPKLDELAKKIRAVIDKSQQLGEPNSETKAKLSKDIEPKITVGLRKVDQQKTRIRDEVKDAADIVMHIEKTFDKTFRKDKN